MVNIKKNSSWTCHHYSFIISFPPFFPSLLLITPSHYSVIFNYFCSFSFTSNLLFKTSSASTLLPSYTLTIFTCLPPSLVSLSPSSSPSPTPHFFPPYLPSFLFLFTHPLPSLLPHFSYPHIFLYSLLTLHIIVIHSFPCNLI